MASPPNPYWIGFRSGLDLELVVFCDKVIETLHAVGYDGAPARYFRSLEPSSPQGASRDTVGSDSS